MAQKTAAKNSAKSPPKKRGRPRKTPPDTGTTLLEGVRAEKPLEAYEALRDDIAARCMVADNPTAYAALVKSLVTVVDRISELSGKDAGKEKKAQLYAINSRRTKRISKAAN